jgi:putative Ca2+/H+ antiporter (TMEM165/GDT1 family)
MYNCYKLLLLLFVGSTGAFQAPLVRHHHSLRPTTRPAIMLSTTQLSAQKRVEYTNSKKENLSLWNSSTTAATTAAIFLTAASFFPAAAHAAPSLSSSAWWSSLTETGFYQAFTLVFLSEIGDKTFFVAGLLGMKLGRWISFVGSVGALAVMTVLSVLIGQVFHVMPSFGGGQIPLDDVAAIAAFAFFGIKTLQDALAMEPGAPSAMDEELAEAEETVQEQTSLLSASRLGQVASIFGLVFAAEFGDRSFLSTIALSAAQNPVSVCGGAIAAHALATGIAVAGGSYLAKYISERVIGIIGGTLFLVFAVTTALGVF